MPSSKLAQLSTPFDSGLRKLLPSIAVLGRQGWLLRPLGLFENLWSRPFAEFRGLPPARFRVRVGVGNRIIFNQAQYITGSIGFWLHYLSKGVVGFESNILEIGCGCGRSAHLLRTYNYGQERFTGQYTGVDIDSEMIDWCKANFPSDHFSFHSADVFSAVYNPTGAASKNRLPADDDTQDFVYSLSLFSHLLSEDVENYVRESARVLKPGGTMAMSFFCLDHMRDAGFLGNRWTFKHRRGPAYVESERYPEAAVAYEDSYVRDLCRQAGFAEVTTTLFARQSILEARMA